MNTTTLRNPFPVLVAGVVSIVIAVGFARTYYLKFLSDAPPLTWLMHIHGLLSTAWLVLHYVQARLVAAHRVALHMKLGVIAAGVGTLMAVQGIMLAIEAGATGHAPPGRNPLQFMAVSMGGAASFGLFLMAALLLRRKREWHKRLMLLATLVLILPAVGRFDNDFLRWTGIPRAIIPVVVTALFIVWAMVNDWRKRGAAHPAYWIGGTALIGGVYGRMWLGQTDAWMVFAKWLTS
jgi:hypothetical protein